MTAAVRWTTSRLSCRKLDVVGEAVPVWSLTAARLVVARRPRTGLLRRIEEREGTHQEGSGIEHSQAFLHGGSRFASEYPRLVKAARTCAAKRSRALTRLGTRCDFPARKGMPQRVRSLWVNGTRRAWKNSGSPQKLRRLSRRFWQGVAALCGWQTCQPN